MHVNYNIQPAHEAARSLASLENVLRRQDKKRRQEEEVPPCSLKRVRCGLETKCSSYNKVPAAWVCFVV